MFSGVSSMNKGELILPLYGATRIGNPPTTASPTSMRGAMIVISAGSVSRKFRFLARVDTPSVLWIIAMCVGLSGIV